MRGKKLILVEMFFARKVDSRSQTAKKRTCKKEKENIEISYGNYKAK